MASMRGSRITMWLALFAATVVLAACGGDEPTPTATETEQGAAPTPEGTGTPPEEEATPEAEPEPASVTMGIQEGAASNLGMIIAQQEGMFADRGLDVEFVALAGSALLPAVTSGDIDFFPQAPQLLATAIQQGSDLRYFCGNVARGDWTGISAPPDADFPAVSKGDTWEDVMHALEGRSIGLAALGATQEHWLVGLLEAAGMSPQDVTMVPVGVGAGAVAALETGQIDALMTYAPVEQILTVSGSGELLFRLSVDGPEELRNQMNTGLIASEAWLDANADVAHRICDAAEEAIAFFQDPANQATVDAVFAEEFGIADPEVRALLMSDEGEGGVLHLFASEIDCEALEIAVGFLQKYGTLTEEPPLTCETMVWRG